MVYRVVELGHVAEHCHLARREAFACVHLRPQTTRRQPEFNFRNGLNETTRNSPNSMIDGRLWPIRAQSKISKVQAGRSPDLAKLRVAGVRPVDVLERKVQEEGLGGLFHAPEELHSRATGPTI